MNNEQPAHTRTLSLYLIYNSVLTDSQNGVQVGHQDKSCEKLEALMSI